MNLRTFGKKPCGHKLGGCYRDGYYAIGVRFKFYNLDYITYPRDFAKIKLSYSYVQKGLRTPCINTQKDSEAIEM
jgi:hypothetical protein